MANQKNVIDWILANRMALDLRVKECTWIRQEFAGWHDIEVSIELAGMKYTGRGSAADSNTALAKAFCEAIERSVCESHGISSLGVAGHFDPEKSKTNALLEYLERSALFNVVKRGQALTPLRLNEKVRERYQTRNIELNLYSLPAEGAEVVLCIASGGKYDPSFGGILGLGADLDVEAAKTKALIECLRNVEAYIQLPAPAISWELFQKLEKPSPVERQALFRGLEYFDSLMNLLSVAGEQISPSPHGEFQKLTVQDGVAVSCPLEFFRFVPESDAAIELDFVG